MNTHDVLRAWGRVLTGATPILSIEITSACPLRCPGCYAYGEAHLGGGRTLRQVKDLDGDALVEGILALVRRHRPLQVSLVGGEPMVRVRELSRVLPQLSQMQVSAMVVSSGVYPIPEAWGEIPLVKVAISVDGLPEHHDVRRAPATYERILRHIAGRQVFIHLTITEPMLARPGYLEDYFRFWSAQPEVRGIWISTYTPQIGEHSPEMLTLASRRYVAESFTRWRRDFPRLILDPATGPAIAQPPASPRACVFAKMSASYTADLKTRIAPCVLGGAPDCSQCGCGVSVAIHAIQNRRVLGPLRARHILAASLGAGGVYQRIKGTRSRDAGPRAMGMPPRR